MSVDQDTLIQEHLKLQREFSEYIHTHGFDYTAYCAPTPGSYYDTYRKRWLELTHAMTSPLHPPEQP